MAEAGSVGNVDEAQEMMKQVETMRQERETIKSAKVEEPGRKVFLVSYELSCLYLINVKNAWPLEAVLYGPSAKNFPVNVVVQQGVKSC